MKTVTMLSENTFHYQIRVVAMMSRRCHWLFPQNKRGITRKLQNLVPGSRRKVQLLRETSGLRICDSNATVGIRRGPRLPPGRGSFTRLLGPRTLLFLLLPPGCSPGPLSGSFGGWRGFLLPSTCRPRLTSWGWRLSVLRIPYATPYTTPSSPLTHLSACSSSPRTVT